MECKDCLINYDDREIELCIKHVLEMHGSYKYRRFNQICSKIIKF